MHEQHTMVIYNDFILYPVLCLRGPDAISNLKTPVYCVTAFVGFSFFFFLLAFPPPQCYSTKNISNDNNKAKIFKSSDQN